ncbi:hypothetical protein CALCODRAFT_518033 [Calocera cornea HHB12733]|uniref:GLTSCR protein conserved domain-containing protein n=1 Tax=Calocera cornea HHB12733 TaxID=1353952 RepID=A0A165FD28_9BASI|nr:hypothetical protein CALCODRAFT_518033 [Calocera cornea HHB12733]
MAHAPAQTEQRQAAAISPTSPSTSASRRQSYSPAAYAAYYAAQLAPSTSKATADNTVTPAGQGEPNNTQRKADEPTEKESAKRKRIAREEDALLMREAAHRVAQAILADQLAVTYPDYKTPFRDATDVVHRLLPYHIFQQPDEDILSTRTRNLKRKEKEDEEAGALRQDVQDLRSNLALLKRRKALQDRFHSIRTKSAKHEAPSEQLYQVQSLALDDDRRYNALLNTEIRATRDQLAQMEKDAREKKEKEQAEARKAYQAYTAQLAAVAQASAAAHSPTARTPGNPYAGYTAATGAVPISSAEIQRQAQSGDYRAAYMQGPGWGMDNKAVACNGTIPPAIGN